MNKRTIALMLAAVMLMSLAACKTENDPVVTTAESVPGAVTIPEGFWETVEATEEKTPAEDAAETQRESEETPETTVPQESEETPETTAPAQDETQPSDREQETVKPTESGTGMTEYEWYNNLSGDAQMAFMESFDSIAAFFDWYNAAKAEYERLNPSIEIGDSNIDLGDLIGGNG